MIVVNVFWKANMGRVKQHKIKNQEEKIPVTLTPSIEDRLKIIANLIVDRIIEDQQNGNLHLRTQNKR